MARYSFSDTTLTALGDVVRSKSEATVYEWRTSAPETVRMGTPNAGPEWGTSTGEYNPNDIAFYRDGKSAGYGLYYFKCENADHFDFKLGVFYSGEDYAVIRVYKGEIISSQIDSSTPVVTFNYNQRHFNLNEFSDMSTTLAGGSYTIVVGHNTKGQFLNEYWMADITAYDADNNMLPIEFCGDNKKLYTLAEMTEIVDGLPATPAPIVLSGTQTYGCASALASSFIKLFPDLVTTSELGDVSYMFNNYKLTTIPFALNCSTYSSYHNMSNMFSNAYYLKELPSIPYAKPYGIAYLINGCSSLKEVPAGWADGWDWSYFHTNNYSAGNATFYGCEGLRRIDPGFLKHCWSRYNSTYSSAHYNQFYNCYSLDEVIGLGVSNQSFTSNMFMNTFNNCYRLKRVVFDTNEDGSAKTANWKNQTIHLTSLVGDASYVYKTNSPEIYPKRVTDDATYELYKDDLDWWTSDYRYARYNHDSAVETINSLPDCSASGGTNTIQFYGIMGSLTDGGAINTLTEEEIAVATAKGWTVTIS